MHWPTPFQISSGGHLGIPRSQHRYDGRRSGEADLSEHGPASHIDEGPWLLEAAFDRPPLRHEDLELRPGAPCFVARERDHSGAAGADSVELGPVVLDAAVPRDDQLPLASSLRNPVLVDRGWASDGTRWPLPPMYDASRVSGIGHVGSQGHDHLGQAEHVASK